MPATKRILRHKAEQAGVTLVLGTEVIGFEKADGAYRIIARHQSQTDHYTADILVNATYAYTNNLLKLLGLHDDMTEYELQKTEVVTVHSEERLPALTVMDGKFVSIMPLANTPHTYLVYDVDHSVVSRENGFFLDTAKTHPSNFAKMVEHGKKYFPFMEKLQFVKSNYGFRPIPLQAVGDSRQTRLLAHQRHQDIYTICEGKFISAPLIADELVQLMKKNNTL
jgi:glycine/D-amino acid oxidase-like deaminating enzyme